MYAAAPPRRQSVASRTHPRRHFWSRRPFLLAADYAREIRFIPMRHETASPHRGGKRIPARCCRSRTGARVQVPPGARTNRPKGNSTFPCIRRNSLVTPVTPWAPPFWEVRIPLAALHNSLIELDFYKSPTQGLPNRGRLVASHRKRLAPMDHVVEMVWQPARCSAPLGTKSF
jgi:hypothetical protein